MLNELTLRAELHASYKILRQAVADESNLGVEDHSFKVDGVTESAPVD
ncbi:hypothetical protein FOYG_04869 [Fusarium oxysporum NRRL 32931]|uniref:Uncharacterized protein n=1 Tax=Fusarium oxysporum NRRL 32931 TaxID=660029 RepID=W9IU17_FUSOX|nr:hypothetical protein FOYG_04869 [Fusarium oxysporum NRRL 32931]